MHLAAGPLLSGRRDMHAYRYLYGGLAVAAGIALGRASTAHTLHRLRVQLEEFRVRASHDPLTGLLNRAGLHEHFTAAPAGRPRVLALLDIDGLKTVNDR